MRFILDYTLRNFNQISFSWCIIYISLLMNPWKLFACYCCYLCVSLALHKNSMIIVHDYDVLLPWDGMNAIWWCCMIPLVPTQDPTLTILNYFCPINMFKIINSSERIRETYLRNPHYTGWILRLNQYPKHTRKVTTRYI